MNTPPTPDLCSPATGGVVPAVDQPMFTLVEMQEHFVVINKRPGVSFHKGRGPRALTQEIRKQCDISQLYPLHRLDTVTSGLLLFARTPQSARELAEQFRLRRTEKFYLAIGGPHPKKKQGIIKGDMERGRRGTWILTKTMLRPAITRFYSTSLQPGLRLYLLKPYTGRTHQLRVALKAISAPVLGDPLYPQAYQLEQPADRTYLHAYGLGFTCAGKSYRFVKMPDEGALFTTGLFREALVRVGQDPWSLSWPSP